ncbi:MAG TPA: hypothetical protein VLT90_10255 [Terriglobales bacterium]|nr:hypothetical protein [Terriglobales bacterium]
MVVLVDPAPPDGVGLFITCCLIAITAITITRIARRREVRA